MYAHMHNGMHQCIHVRMLLIAVQQPHVHSNASHIGIITSAQVLKAIVH